jgi:hypothetical protein
VARQSKLEHANHASDRPRNCTKDAAVIRALKSVLKPAFMRGLEGWTQWQWRWRNHRPGGAHRLPHRLVVSLTSYPKRFDVLELTLKTLLMQDVRPDDVVLWIAHEDMRHIPPAIAELQNDGLTIRATDDLRSYKKIIPGLQHYSDAIIVTADDDVYYPRDWLRRLTREYRDGVAEVLCHRAHLMRRAGDGFLPYDSWTFNIRTGASTPEVFFTGVGGVLYPPGVLHGDVTDVARIRELCPNTDDVWLNWMARLNGAAVRKVDGWIRFYEWSGSQDVALQNSNRGENGGNDLQIANLVRAYGIPGGHL